ASSDSSSLGLADSDSSFESSSCSPLARVHSGGSPAGPPGVGSKRTQPAPSEESSGQAEESCILSTEAPSDSSPPAKPTPMRAGIPMVLAMIVIAEENWTQ